jgi:hypothetical protein
LCSFHCREIGAWPSKIRLPPRQGGKKSPAEAGQV